MYHTNQWDENCNTEKKKIIIIWKLHRFPLVNNFAVTIVRLNEMIQICFQSTKYALK